MFRRSRRAAAPGEIAAPRVSSVRVLVTPEELREAVERAMAFERMNGGRGAPALRYERYLRNEALSQPVFEGDQGLAEVVLIDPDSVGA